MLLAQAIEHAINGNAVLFLGAGYSREATAVNGSNLPTGNRLAVDLMTACGNPDSTADLRVASSYFQKQKGKNALVELLSNAFTASSTTPAQALISQVRWKRIYTTNYDDVVEVVYAKASKPL